MSRQFTIGAAAALSWMMMIQDWYGLEGYIQFARDHWVELPWQIGAALVVLFTYLGRDRGA